MTQKLVTQMTATELRQQIAWGTITALMIWTAALLLGAVAVGLFIVTVSR